MGYKHYAFPKIRQFRTAIREIAHRAQFVGVDDDGELIMNRNAELPVLKFRGTVKLHGCNAGIVRHPDGMITFQSRTRRLTPVGDTFGFAKYMEEEVGNNALTDFFMTNIRHEEDDVVCVYGEWCGRKVQKNVAISTLDKMFVIFAIRVGNEENGWRWLDMKKNPIEMPDHRIFNIMNFPHYELEIDFNKPHEAQAEMVRLVEQVEARCPVGHAMGSDGVGEGIVWSCWEDGWNNSRFFFKTKGAKHSASKVKVLAAVDIEKAKSVADFVDYAVTENRLQQGLDFLRENEKPLDRCSTPDYLRWVANDVLSEEEDTMEASGLTKKDIGKAVSTKARKWFFGYLDEHPLEM